MKRITALLALLVSALPFCARAQSSGIELNMDRGFYIGANVGRAKLDQDCLGVCDTSDTSWNAYAGYQLHRNIAVELGYADLGSVTTSGTVLGGTATARIETTAWELVGVGLLPLTESFTIYFKAGLFRYDSDAVSTGAVTAVSSARGTEFTIGGGLQYAFTRNIAGRVEWQSYPDIGGGVPGLAKGDIHVWRVGARAKF